MLLYIQFWNAQLTPLHKIMKSFLRELSIITCMGSLSCSHRSFSSSMFTTTILLCLVAEVFCIWQFFLAPTAFSWPPYSMLATTVSLLTVPLYLRCSVCQSPASHALGLSLEAIFGNSTPEQLSPTPVPQNYKPGDLLVTTTSCSLCANGRLVSSLRHWT